MALLFAFTGITWFSLIQQDKLEQEINSLHEQTRQDSITIAQLKNDKSDFLRVLNEHLGLDFNTETAGNELVYLLDTTLQNDLHLKQELRDKLADNQRRFEFLDQFNQIISQEKVADYNRILSLSNELESKVVYSDSLFHTALMLKEELRRVGLDSMTLVSPLGDQLFYYGRVKDGQPYGFGVGFYSGKGYYMGEYDGNKRVGRGKHFYKNGDRYEGDFRNDSRHGFGVYYFSSGDRYTGEWKDDLMNGTGEMVTVDGERITGVWAKGKMVQVD